MIGALLGNRYELLEKIGEGGMAEVYKAKCHILNRFVAIKILKNEFNEDSTFIEKFRREAFAAASLTHPNIVQIYDVGRDNNLNYIVFEYVDGYTLKDVIRKYGSLDNQAIINYSIQICKALMCAHKNGIIHRDIKPHNILVTNEGTLKVTDFGIAKASTSSTVTSGEKILGTPYYLSPEQARGDSVDKRSDLYSFGIVMYEMCTGIVPFVGDNLVTVVLKHVQELPKPPIELNSDVNDSLNNIVLRLLQKSPQDRYQDANDVLTDLRKVQNSQAVYYNPDDSKTSVITPTRILNTSGNTSTNEITLEETVENNNKWVGRVIWAIVIAGAITVGIFIGKIWLGSWNSGISNSTNTTIDNSTENELVTIPEILGKPYDDAKNMLIDKGLDIEVTSKEASETIPKDSIVRIDGFNVGDEVPAKSTINVVLSLGKQVKIPEVSGLPINEAQRELTNIGLKITTNLISDPNIPKGRAVKTDPPAGESVDINSSVILYSSDGPKQQRVIIPNLIGMNINDAVKMLQDKRLDPFPIQVKITDKNYDLQVKSTNPLANEEVPVGTRVEIQFYQYEDPNQNNTTQNTTQNTSDHNNSTINTTQNTTNATQNTQQNTTNITTNTTIQNTTNATQSTNVNTTTENTDENTENPTSVNDVQDSSGNP